LAIAVLVAACGGGSGGAGSSGGGGSGGGGGGGGSPALSFSPATATLTARTGTASTLYVTATPATGISGSLYAKLLSSTTDISQAVSLAANSDGTYTLGITSANSLAKGTYSGTLSIAICTDSACSHQVSGSPVSLPYNFSITDASAQIFAPNPAILAATFTAGAPPELDVTLTPSPVFTAILFVSVSAPQLLQNGTSITANPDGTYLVRMRPLTSLTVGHLSGMLSLSLCYDSACASKAAGSPVNLPYDWTLVAPPPPLTLTPATLTGTFVAGYPFPFAITAQASPSPTVAVGSVSVTDGSGTFQSNASYAYSDPTNPHPMLTVQATPTLAPGHYAGTLQLNVCSDSGCQTPVLGSPMSVPYDVTLTSPPLNSGKTPLSAWPGVSPWATYQGNASHTGFVPVTLDKNQFGVRWFWDAPQGGQPLSTMTAAAGRLYLNVGHTLYALSEFDSSTLWTHDFSSIQPYPQIISALNPPATSDGNVYITTSAQTATYMFGLAAKDGSQLFQSQFSAQWENYLAPTIFGSAAYTDGGTYGGMLSFDTTSGAQNFFAFLPQYDQWTPAVDASYAYAYTGGSLIWVDRLTGTQIGTITDPTWSWAGYSMRGAPVLGSAGSVLAINVGNSYANSLLDFSVGTSAVNWSVAGPYGANPAYANGVVYALNKSPMRLEARTEMSGALVWSWSPPTASETSYVGDPVVTNNIAFLSTNTTVYAIDLATHLAVWSLPTAARLALSENGVLYVEMVDGTGSTTGRLVAVNVK
jgi:hypothetical protein